MDTAPYFHCTDISQQIVCQFILNRQRTTDKRQKPWMSVDSYMHRVMITLSLYCFFLFLFASLYLLLVCFIITWVLKCHPCLVGTVVEVLPKDKKKKEEEKSAILGQCSVDLLPMLTGFGYFLVMLLVVFATWRSYASHVLGVVILSVCQSVRLSVCHITRVLCD